MTVLLEAESLYFSWDHRGSGWFQNLNLSLETGHIYGLMGRNGAGKTTLLKLLMGCLKPSAGNIRTSSAQGKVESFIRSPDSLSETVFVAENSELPNMTAFKLGEHAGRLYPRFSLSQYGDHLKALEVRSDQSLPSLSFGQRRKAHIAFALATNASMIFLDEPSNGLDVAAQIVLRKLLIAQAGDTRSIVVSTHHVREFETVIDRMIVLDQGRILANEMTENLAAEPNFKDLETWYAQKIGVNTSSYVPKGVQHEDI
jgi:ABC-2 type transport system ATP-binding protein